MNIEQLKKAILEEKKKNDVFILAHTYQSPDIIDVADFAGDSYALSVVATSAKCNKIVLCGVKFMAETAKILSPEKEVVLPVLKATCPMAEQISPARVKAFKEENPDVAVVAYINTTAELKAECDVCVTSSSAVKIVKALPNKDILFIPDKNLGAWVSKQIPDKNFIFWDGYCPVHNSITAEDVLAEKAKHPNAKLIVHPECKIEVSDIADFAGATSAIINYCKENDDEIIIGTEHNVYDYLIREMPDKKFHQLCADKLTCDDMAMVTLQDVYNAVVGKGPAPIEMDEDLRLRAKDSIDNMLKYGG